jgi:hypothetical protein
MNVGSAVLIFANGRHTKHYNSQMFPAFKKYRKWTIRKKMAEQKVWFDHVGARCFGHEETMLNSRGVEHYLADSKDFVGQPMWGLPHVQRYYAKAMGSPNVVNQEIIYKHIPRISEFVGSKILLVGGGPSTITHKWNPKNYDFIFSCNHFFLNKKLAQENVAFSLLGTEVDTSAQNKPLHRYARNNDTIWCFETTNRPIKQMKGYYDLYPEKTTYVHTRYRSKIGAMPRLIVIAILFGVKEIDVVGMDGIAPGDKGGQVSVHAFQPGKRYDGTFGHTLYKRQYLVFWDYIVNQIGKNVKIRNLGQGHPANMSTPITKVLLK